MSALQLIFKFALSAGIAVAVAEIAKRSTYWAALLASLPLTSALALIWLYVDTADTQQVAALSTGILWLILPSLVFFVVLPLLLRQHWGFIPSMLVASVATMASYLVTLRLLALLGIRP